MKKKSILYLLILALVLLCSCSDNSKLTFKELKNVSYKESVQLDYKSLHNTNAVLMFKSNPNNEELGELYIKLFDKDKEKIADNVYKNQYILLNNNDIVYIDVEYNLYLKKYGQDATKIAKNVPFDSVYVSSKNSIYYKTYENDDFLENYESNYQEILLDIKGNSLVLFDSKAKYDISNSYKYFTDNGEFLYFLNGFDTLSRVNTEGKIENLAGNVSSFTVTQDGSAYAYNNYNNRLYIKWSGAQEASFIKKLDVYDDYQLSNNGLSCIFAADDSDETNLMFVSPFNEPVSITKNNYVHKSSSNNEYLYVLDENNNLYGYKLPKITAKTKSEDLKKQLDELKETLIGTDISYFTISHDGKSVSYINSNNELYTSYELAEAVKIQDNISNIEYIYNAIVFQDINLKLYVNDALNDMSKVVSSSKEICDNSEFFYVENNSLDYFIYMDKESDLYIYSIEEKLKLIIDNVEEYNIVKGNYVNLYEKSLSIDDIVGIYSCENNSNSYDSFVIAITSGDITLIFDDYSSKREISVVESTQTSISLTDDEGYSYSIYKNNDELSLEIYDDEIDSYYQYKVKNIANDEFNEKLEHAQLEMKFNAVYEVLEDYYYNGYTATEALPMYHERSVESEIIGYTVKDDEYYVHSYYVEDDYNFWLNLEYIDSDGNNDYAWIYINPSNINIEN